MKITDVGTKKGTRMPWNASSPPPHSPPDLFLGQRFETRVSPPGDPGSQRLVLSKLCQPPNDLQQRAVSLLILGIPLPHHLPDPPHPPVPSIRPSPRVLLCVPAAHANGCCLLGWRQPIGASRHPSLGPDWQLDLRDYQLLSEKGGGVEVCVCVCGCSFLSP